MRIPAVLRSWGRTRLLILAAALTMLAGAGLALVLADPNDQVALQTSEDDTTTTTDEVTSTTTTTTTTSTSATSTTAAPTTTVAPTTTAAPVTTAAPPPPPPAGSLDMDAVVAFAKAHRNPASVPPKTYTGANMCPAFVQPPSDAGDDTVRDITTWAIGRYCDGVYRLSLPTGDEAPLDSFWLRADTGPGGCGGIDRVVVAWTVQPWGGNHPAGVVATPSCDTSSWGWVDAAGSPIYNGAWLQLDFRGAALGNPSSFTWRAGVKATGESGAAVDVVPNGGPGTFHA
jgi:hypothetical protein